MPLKPIPLSALQTVGKGLDRPAGVAVDRGGRLWTSDPQSAIAWLKPDGGIKRLGIAGGSPHGLSVDAQDRMVIANFGMLENAPGPLQRLDLASGKMENLCETLEGRTLIASCQSAIAGNGTIYCTHASWGMSLASALDSKRADGFVYCVDKKGHARKLSDGFKFAGGCCLDYKDKNLFVSQTMTATIMRLEIMGDGGLGQPKPYGPVMGQIPSVTPLGPPPPPARERARHGYVGGMGLDADGNLWAALPGSNRVIAVTPNLHPVVMIDDPAGQILKMPITLAWGGPELKDLYIGSYESDYVIKAPSPVPGMPLVHQR